MYIFDSLVCLHCDVGIESIELARVLEKYLKWLLELGREMRGYIRNEEMKTSEYSKENCEICLREYTGCIT